MNSLFNNIVVIGGNTAGLAAANQARRVNPNLNITVLEAGNYISYGSCGFPYYLSGAVEKIENLFSYPVSFFEEKRNIKILLNHRVTSINPFKKEITVSACTGSNPLNTPGNSNPYGNIFIRYDRLVICSGASPVKFDYLEQTGVNNLFYFHSPDDATNLKNFIDANNPVEAVIAGGGYLGLLIADALCRRNIRVSIIEARNRIYGDYENEIMEVLHNSILKSGVRIFTSSRIKKINFSSKTKLAYSATIETSAGQNSEEQQIDAGLFIIATGIKPNTDFLAGTAIDTGSNGAIKTSTKLQTSQANIFAAGDCCLVRNVVTKSYDYLPSAGNALKMGRIAGANAAGENENFYGSLGTKLDRIFGLEIARTGANLDKALEFKFDAVKVTDTFSSHQEALPGAENIMISVIADKKTRRLLGVQMAGKKGVAKRIDVFAAAIASEMKVDDLYMLDTAYAPYAATSPDAVNRICGKAVIILNSSKF
ncbi:MAG: hypothetical protein FJW66_00045 [Actinobacteria bacterium]|nr:hypothetical protein [Actinomycetota bacterium]